MTSTAKLCADCTGEFEPKRPNAKYCVVCRVLRDLIYIAGRKSTCYACDKKYAPLVRKDILCGSCDLAAASAQVAPCGFCSQAGDKTPKPLLSDSIAVCLPCAKDPHKRSDLLKALMAKQAARRAEGAAA